MRALSFLYAAVGAFGISTLTGLGDALLIGGESEGAVSAFKDATLVAGAVALWRCCAC